MGRYEERLVIVENALKGEGVKATKGKTLEQAAVKVLAAIDEIKETVR